MAGNLKNEIILVTFLLACRSVDGQITNRPDDQEVCIKEDLKIDWVYGDASNFLTVTWAFKNSSSAAATTFMSITTGASTATVIGDLNVEFNGNGAITLKEVDFSYSGDYKISVNYISSTLPDDDTVTVTVKDCGEPPASDCTCKSLNDCDIPEPVCILLWILIGLVIVGAGITGICLILHYCFDVKIPYCCKRKNTNSAAAEPQGTQNGEGQILHNRDTENSANYTKKRPPAKLEQLDKPESEKHHIGGRPLPQIGKYN